MACNIYVSRKDMIYCKSQMFDENIYHFSPSDTCNYLYNRTFQQHPSAAVTVTAVQCSGWLSLIGAWIWQPSMKKIHSLIYVAWKYDIQSNLAIRNFLVALKLFLSAKSSLSLWSKWQIGHGKWFLNTNLFLIKKFLIAKFDCSRKSCKNVWKP